mmetsp:Transcript_15673/g.47400  ORF Transcript_15673/g.47400 Transcript_15673/m.47400 type:complete len:339 (+) Transcript_15673:25-1041(+)
MVFASRGRRLVAAALTTMRAEALTTPLAQRIRSGPIYEAAKLGAVDVERWRAMGERVVSELGLDAAAESTSKRIYEFYLPLYAWMRRRVPEERKKTVILGLHCPQGGGKTTMCDVLEGLFERDGLSCVVASIDDFYLTHAELEALAARHAANPLLAGRGPPGTHDARLLASTLDALRRPGTVAIPRYDKSAHAGKGDRRPAADWPAVQAPVDVVVLEGWCLGFRPKADTADPHLRQIDDFLRTDLAPLYDTFFDAFVTLRVPDPNVVYTWREQAEAQLRAKGKPAMTQAQIVAFVDRYMPLYKHYLPGLYASDVVPGNTLNVAINERREPIPLQSSSR